MKYRKVLMENLLEVLLSLLQRPIPRKPVPIVIRTRYNQPITTKPSYSELNK